jgi:hypothetical protein
MQEDGLRARPSPVSWNLEPRKFDDENQGEAGSHEARKVLIMAFSFRNPSAAFFWFGGFLLKL